MKIQYDAKVDAMYIELAKGRIVPYSFVVYYLIVHISPQ